jgi:hypothetical protein
MIYDSVCVYVVLTDIKVCKIGEQYTETIKTGYF